MEGFRFPNLLICEGPDDVLFFRELIEQRNLPRFHLRYPGSDTGGRGGNSKFGKYIQDLELHPTFRRAIRRILIVSDSDGDHDASFRRIAADLDQKGLVAPAAPMQGNGRNPEISILMIPPGQAGCLETLCVPAARTANRHSASVDAFVAMVTMDRWPDVARGKLWLRAGIAAEWQRDPFIHLGEAIGHRVARQMIPLDHTSFDQVANYLASFA